jgi:tripartite-type tricarboxylate transporter receptor subunit TctC
MIRFLSRVTLAAALLALAGAAPAAADNYPSKPIKLVVPYPAGGTADILARVIGQQLWSRLGQPVVVENRPGAGTAIGAEAVAKAEPDGYTLLMGTVSSHAMNPSITRVDYDPIKDFTPVAGVASVPFVLVVSPSTPAQSVGELIALAKSKPGEINYASAGNGTSNHLAGELFRSMAGIDIVHVPYRGSAPALSDVIAGHVQMMFDLAATALPQVRAKTVRALGIASRARSPLAPDLPTIAEAGLPGFEASAWFGIFGPAGLPSAVADKLRTEIDAALKSPEVRERLTEQASDPLTFETSAAFAAFVKAERERWGKLIRDAKITAG